MKHWFKLGLILLLISGLLAGCGDTVYRVEVTPASTTTTEPTATAQPTSAPRPSPTSAPTVAPTFTLRPILTTTAEAGPGVIAGAGPVVGGKYIQEVSLVRQDILKKWDVMNEKLAEMRTQVAAGDWNKAKDSWKAARAAFLSGSTLASQVLYPNNLYQNLDATLDEEPTYGFQATEKLLWDSSKPPTKETVLPIVARLVRDGNQARSLMLKAELSSLMVFRGLQNLAGGLVLFVIENGTNSLSGTSVVNTRAKLQAIKDQYAIFSPAADKLDAATNKKVLAAIQTMQEVLSFSIPDPGVVDQYAKRLRSALVASANLLKIDPILEGPDLLKELDNLRLSVDATLDGLAQDNMDITSERFSEVEATLDGKLGRSLREVDPDDYQALDTLRKSINEALFFGTSPDKVKGKQSLIDFARAVDKTITNVKKIPVTNR